MPNRWVAFVGEGTGMSNGLLKLERTASFSYVNAIKFVVLDLSPF